MLAGLALLAQVHAAGRITPLGGVRFLAQAYRLWDPQTATPMVAIPFSFADPAYDDAPPGTRPTLLDLQCRVEAAHLKHTDTAMVVHFTVAAGASHGTGYCLLPVRRDVDTTLWQIADTRHPTEHRPTVLAHGSMPALRGTGLVLSDIVVGDDREGTVNRFPFGSDSVAIAPREIMPRTGLLHVFYQLRNDTVRSRLVTTLTITRVVGVTVEPDQILSMRFTDAVPAGISSVERDVGVTELPGGRYRLTVAVADPDGTIRSSRTTHLELGH
jgi:hypothetical protein